jgi:hypothetical protein
MPEVVSNTGSLIAPASIQPLLDDVRRVGFYMSEELRGRVPQSAGEED